MERCRQGDAWGSLTSQSHLISELQDMRDPMSQEPETQFVLVSMTKRVFPTVPSVKRDDAVAMTLCPTYGIVVQAVN